MAYPPSGVAAGELIESAWGNDVVSGLDLVSVYAVMQGISKPGGQLRVEAGFLSTTTNASGDFTHTIGGAGVWQGNPFVIVANSYPTGPLVSHVLTTSPASFSVRTWWGHGGGIGTAYANQPISIFWLAIGLRP